MLSSKGFLRIVCLLCLAINLYIVFYVYESKLKDAQARLVVKQRKTLEYFHATCNFKSILEKKLKDFFYEVEGIGINELEKKVQKLCADIDIPEKSFKFIAYNVSFSKTGKPKKHRVFNMQGREKQAWEYLMDCLDTMNDRFFTRVAYNSSALTKLEKPSLLVRKPYKLIQVSSGMFNTYAIWFNATKAFKNDKVNSIVVLIHDVYIKSRTSSFVKLFFKINNINEDRYGYLNSDEPEKHHLPDGFSANEISEALAQKEVKTGFIDLDKLGVLICAKPNGNVFVAIKRKPRVAFPLWAISLPFIWLPVWYKHYIAASGNFKFSLTFLNRAMFILILIFPMVLIANYWNKMIVSEQNNIKQRKIRGMFNQLAQLDSMEDETRRLNIKCFRNMIDLVKRTEKNPLGVNNINKLQDLIDETVRLELNHYFDYCFIIDEKGKFIRDYPTASSFYRLLATYPLSYKDAVIEQYLNANWVPRSGEMSFIYKHDDGIITLSEFMGLSTKQMSKSLVPTIKVISKEIIELYNTKKLGLNYSSPKNNFTSGMLASAFGGKGEEYITSIYNRLGNYFFGGFAKDGYNFYSDVLRDDAGKAKYAIFLVSNTSTLSQMYLKNLFYNSDRWRSDVKYLAVTNAKSINYPYLDLWKKFGFLLETVKPPITQYATELNINGEPNLVCAYRCNKLSNYLLLATTPMQNIKDELFRFELKMIALACIVVLLLLFVLYKINESVLVPTKQLVIGINAINNKKLDYEVVVDTEDEWKNIANAFNQSAKTLKELEIATFLQDTILPSGFIETENIKFHGKTVSVDGIGGDYFDCFIPDKKQMMFLFGDVSGHSVGAALVVSMAHAGFASLFDSGIRQPSEMLKSFSSLMITNLKRVKMMTCFAGFIDADGNMTFSNAGQTFPLIVDRDGNVKKVSLIGYPLGSAKRAKFKEDTVRLPDRCRIVLYSDGMVEAMDKEDEPFGYDRLEQVVRQMACRNSIIEFKNSLYEELKKFTGNVPWNDDCSVVIIDYERKTDYINDTEIV